MANAECWVKSCSEPPSSWGMCVTHRQLWDWFVRIPRTHLSDVTDAQRFDHYAIKDVSAQVQEAFGASPDCWIWGGGLSRYGYGIFRSEWASRDGGSTFARFYSLANSSNSDENFLRKTEHTCRFPPCVNGSHLKLKKTAGGVSLKAEAARNERLRYTPSTGIRGQGQYRAARETCTEGHKLEGENVLREGRVLDGKISYIRRCRTCTRKRQRDHYAKRAGKR